MPIYEYQCEECKDKFTRLQRLADDPLKHCNKCDKDSLVKVISSNIALDFRGAGEGCHDDGRMK